MHTMERAVENAGHLVVTGHMMAIAEEALREVDEGAEGVESEQCPQVLSVTLSKLLKSFGITDDSDDEKILDDIKKTNEKLESHLNKLQEKISTLEKELKKPKNNRTEDEQEGDRGRSPSQDRVKGKFNRTVLK